MANNYSKIAKNTIFVYIKLIINVFVGLLSSRWVLQSLGNSDYGLYSVVGGILTIITFISSSMSQTTTRFINYEMGESNGDINRIFNVCQNIHICMTLVVILLAETIGLYYVNNILNVDPGKESDALFCFQVSTIVACLGILNVPYQGLLNSYERFKTIAIVDVISTILRFFCVLLLFLFDENVLRIYASLMSIISLFSFITYHWICYKNWPEIVKINFRKTKGHYKKILVHNNYNTLLSGSLIIRDQGSNMIINYFFGTAINAAYAIARTVLNYVNMLAGNFDAASGPQIVQNVANGDYESSEVLVNKIGRFSFLVAVIGVTTLLPELDFILNIWLKDVPEGSLEFSYLALILVIVSSTSSGLSQLIQALGKLKWFMISFSSLYFLCIPFSIIAFLNEAQPFLIVLLFILADIIARIVQLYLLKKYATFNVARHIRDAYLRPFTILLIMIFYSIISNHFLPDTMLFSVINICLAFFVVSFLSLLIGVKKNERTAIINGLKHKLR